MYYIYSFMYIKTAKEQYHITMNLPALVAKMENDRANSKIVITSVEKDKGKG